ncbi:LCP family protein [Streptomonospora nanhaiensis]|uniref:LCP family protein required for cell wall assembly n=1 Tax=Streptomonospora nanhaiensis TaxID=1323731 RepID=A0A853BT28_9ACTN|nr:LCP family protein [Streptomonospora nanhaiensis]MBX9391645.1 LCP family protein [Streptomonospora nanhaiensis]NYI97661.1 LCP family protein required for cell wall assembly [Streptomonospora nanhaiensis]
MVDGPHGRGRGGSADDADRTGVFRRPPGGGADEIEKLFRPEPPRRSAPSGAGPTRRIPPVEDDRPARRSASSGGGRGRHGPPRDYDGSGRSRRAREQRRRRRRTVLVTVLVVLVLVPAVFYFWADSRLNRVPALDYEGRLEDQPGTTYMIVGSDSREGLTDEDMQNLRTGDAAGKRTDTIMVLYVPESGRPTIISVPRDSYVEIPGLGQNKINAAFAEDLGGGPTTLVQTFEQASGVHIDHYVEIGFSGFVDIVDAVGGVEMCPEEAMVDPKAGLDIEAGCQEMDGATALGYVRTRASARADLDRIQRQREFFSALVSKATSPGTLVNPFRSVPLVVNGTDTFVVDEGDHLSDLAGMALAMRDDPATTAVPVGATPTLPGVGSVVQWDEARSAEMFGAMQEGQPIPESAMQD